MRESDEKVKQKFAEKKKTVSVASGMKGERQSKGKLSFALAHTQACHKDSKPSTRLTYRGFCFSMSVAHIVYKQRKPLCVAATVQSISGTSFLVFF